MSVDVIVKGLCKTDSDAVDKRILFELAGIRMEDDDYRNESSFEEEDDDGNDERSPQERVNTTTGM